VFAFKCSKSSPNDGYLEGKVIRTSCADVVVQVLNNDTIGEDGWKDIMNNNAVYDNVFAVNNACKFSENLKTGKTIRFKISQSTDNGCMFCQLYDGQPMTNYSISEVSLVEGH
jgi:hypothetical protein